MKWIGLLSLLIFSSATSTLAQSDNPIFTDSSFVGLVIRASTFEEGDEALRRKSFKRPQKTYRCVRTRDGGWSIINNTYFIKVNKAKVSVSLMGGGEKINKIIVDVITPGKELAYQSIVLGKTKVTELEERLQRSDWKEMQSYDQHYFYIEEGNFHYCVKIDSEGQSIKELQAHSITRFVIQKPE